MPLPNILLLALLSHISLPPPKALSDGARVMVARATRGLFALLICRQNRLSRGVKGILVAGLTVTTLVTSAATASAQNIFEALFGRLWILLSPAMRIRTRRCAARNRPAPKEASPIACAYATDVISQFNVIAGQARR